MLWLVPLSKCDKVYYLCIVWLIWIIWCLCSVCVCVSNASPVNLPRPNSVAYRQWLSWKYFHIFICIYIYMCVCTLCIWCLCLCAVVMVALDIGRRPHVATNIVVMMMGPISTNVSLVKLFATLSLSLHVSHLSTKNKACQCSTQFHPISIFSLWYNRLFVQSLWNVVESQSCQSTYYHVSLVFFCFHFDFTKYAYACMHVLGH